MKNVFMLLLIGTTIMLSSNAPAFTINFATGQDSSGVIQTAGNSLDANWKATNGSGLIPTYVTAPDLPDWSTFWQSLTSTNSSWIAPFPNNERGNGNYTFTYAFDLTGYDLATANFSGMKFSMDDGAYVYLNNQLIGHEHWGPMDYTFSPLTINTSYLVNGINTIMLSQDSTDNIEEAMRFEGTLDIARAPVPVPPSLLLLAPGLAGLAAIRRRLNK